MRRALIFMAAALVLVGGATAGLATVATTQAAAQPAVLAELLVNVPRTLSPGQAGVGTAIISVPEGGQPINLGIYAARLPSDEWRDSTTSGPNERLEPGESEMFTFRFRVPEGTAPGRYVLGAGVLFTYDSGKNAAEATDILTVR